MLIGLFYETACLFVGYFIVKDVSSVYIFLCGNFHYFLYLTTKLQLFWNILHYRLQRPNLDVHPTH